MSWSSHFILENVFSLSSSSSKWDCHRFAWIVCKLLLGLLWPETINGIGIARSNVCDYSYGTATYRCSLLASLRRMWSSSSFQVVLATTTSVTQPSRRRRFPSSKYSHRDSYLLTLWWRVGSVYGWPIKRQCVDLVLPIFGHLANYPAIQCTVTPSRTNILRLSVCLYVLLACCHQKPSTSW